MARLAAALLAAAALPGALLPCFAAWLPLLPRDPRSRASLLPRRNKQPDSYGPDNYYTRKAQEEGLPARSYFKLEELDGRLGLLQPGHKVLDLGCYPGSWTLYAGKRVGKQGRVLGIDLRRVEIDLPRNCKTRVEDAYKFRGGSVPPLDVVLSDMAPNTGLEPQLDHERSVRLVELAMGIADSKLVVGGAMIAKLFDGYRTKDLMTQMRIRYETPRIMRPRSTRKQSREIYLVGLGKKVQNSQAPSRWRAPAPARQPPKVAVPQSFSGW